VTATPSTSTARSVTDPIALELLRSRLEAVAEDAALTIERTSVSPTATETHDLSATLLDAAGGLVAGGGWVSYHWVAATHAVRSTIERYGDEIHDGDVFFANDPYSGGGLHPNDVFVERPIFVGGRLVAWVALSAHLADMGGMAMGSFAPAATECYQEAFRSPPVRLFRAGEENTDVWDLLRTNVRLGTIVEMDLRALVAGSHVAQQKVTELAGDVGLEHLVAGMAALQHLSERELRRRIEAMPDGTYHVRGWADWDDELFVVPCTLTIAGDHMVFDFEGAAPQAPHFFNSQPYIIKSAMVMQFARQVAADLPYTEGLLAPIELRCPEGSIVNARPPAPMNAGHMHVGGLAAETMLQTVRLALWATSPALPASKYVHGPSTASLLNLAMWAGHDPDGELAVWGMADGTWSGGSGTPLRDGTDQSAVPVGMAQSPNTADVEVIESWYPLLVVERCSRRGVNGAGEHRSGAGGQLKLQPYGGGDLTGQMLGTREWMPLDGAAGGFPGSTTVYEVTRRDGTVERVSTKAAGVVLEPGDTFEVRTGSSGGVGDPLDRDPAAVARDVAIGRITPEEARAAYGVVIDHGAVDRPATDARRDETRTDRLARASAPRRPVTADDVAELPPGDDLPLYPGVVQRGPVAYAEQSGVPLAIAPDHWTDGCPVLEEPVPEQGPGRRIVARSYLDPRTGRTLYVESVPAGEGRAFAVLPDRWTQARRS
jgi:N-methylhydantoinase B